MRAAVCPPFEVAWWRPDARPLCPSLKSSTSSLSPNLVRPLHLDLWLDLRDLRRLRLLAGLRLGVQRSARGTERGGCRLLAVLGRSSRRPSRCRWRRWLFATPRRLFGRRRRAVSKPLVRAVSKLLDRRVLPIPADGPLELVYAVRHRLELAETAGGGAEGGWGGVKRQWRDRW